MGIQVEFNPDLCLRDRYEFSAGRRKNEECLPEKLEQGKVYDFLKEGQRNFYMAGEFPLRETKGNQQLSRPLASIIMVEATHFLQEGKIWTKGKYKVVKLLGTGASVYFEGYEKPKN
jgi:hypothetical protein